MSGTPSNLNRRASSYPNFICSVTRSMLMLVVMESGDAYLDGNVTYHSEKRTFEVEGCEIDAFREYIEALVIDDVPALRAGAASQIEGNFNDHIEVLAVLTERSIESSTERRAPTIRSKVHFWLDWVDS